MPSTHHNQLQSRHSLLFHTLPTKTLRKKRPFQKPTFSSRRNIHRTQHYRHNKHTPQPTLVQNDDDIPLVFKRTKPKPNLFSTPLYSQQPKPHSSPTSDDDLPIRFKSRKSTQTLVTAAFSIAAQAPNQLKVSTLPQLTLKEAVFDLQYAKNSVSYGNKSFSRKRKKSNSFVENAYAQHQKSVRPKLKVPTRRINVTFPIFCTTDLMPNYRSQEFSSLLDIANFLLKEQLKFLQLILPEARKVIQKLFLEKHNQTTSGRSSIMATVFGPIMLPNRMSLMAKTELQRLSKSLDFSQLTEQDFFLFFNKTQKLIPPFKRFAEAHLVLDPKLVLHMCKPQAYADVYSLEFSSRKNYTGTLRQFSRFLLGSDGIQATQKARVFLRTHKFANHQIANFLLFLSNTTTNVFITLRSKMIHLSFFQRPRQDRFSKVKEWYKIFLQNSIGRHYKVNFRNGAPPFSRQDLMALFQFMRAAPKADFPTKRLDFYVFQLVSIIACRTFEFTALTWSECDFDDFHFFLYIHDRKNEKINGTPHKMVFKATGSPTCPVYLINKIWDLSTKSNPFVFPQPNGQAHSNKTLNKLLNTYLNGTFAAKRAKKFTFYSFRTSYAVLMAAADVDTTLIQKHMGHKSEATTHHYIQKQILTKAQKGDYLQELKREPEDLVLDEKPGLNIGFWAFNTSKPPFDNPQVRRALGMAIDKNALIEAIYFNNAVAAKNIVPRTSWAFQADVRPLSYNPIAAKKLLRKQGIPDDFTMTVWAMPVQRAYNPNAMKMAELIKAYLQKVDIQVNIISYEWSTFRERLTEGLHDSVLIGWSADNGDPDNFYRPSGYWEVVCTLNKI